MGLSANLRDSMATHDSLIRGGLNIDFKSDVFKRHNKYISLPHNNRISMFLSLQYFDMQVNI